MAHRDRTDKELYESQLCPMNVSSNCVTWCSSVTTNSESKDCLWFFCLLWDLFPSNGWILLVYTWGNVPSLIVTWYPWEAYLFFWREKEEEWIWMRGDVGGKILEGGKGERNCGLNVMNERKMNKKYMKVYNATKKCENTWWGAVCYKCLTEDSIRTCCYERNKTNIQEPESLNYSKGEEKEISKDRI